MKQEYLICKAKINSKKEIVFSGPSNSALSLEDQILEDKKYGVMTPANGKYFTYSCEDWNGKFITSKQIRKAQTLVWEELERKLDFEVRRAKPNEIVDFKLVFRRTADDPLLTRNTLQYHYYPINDIHAPLRGLCVVNTDHPWTVHGEPLSMHEIDPDHYPEDTTAKGSTIDFDQVYGSHEIVHGLGLPHSPKPNKTMSGNYRVMAEHFEDEDPSETLPRLAAKYRARRWHSRRMIRFNQWKRHRFDNY